jgi:hypothetical protein
MYHFEGITTASFGGDVYRRTIARNSLRFRERWHGVFSGFAEELPAAEYRWLQRHELGLQPTVDLAYADWQKKGLMRNLADLRDAIYHGAVKRVRPKAMTASVIIAGLLPIMWSHGTGADVMKRIAAPMVGGVITSTVLELVIYPAIYMIWKRREFRETR